MIKEELINVFKYIVKKCDMLINNDDYEADAYTQDTVEDIAELCNHILDEGYRKLIEAKKVDLDEEVTSQIRLLNGVHTLYDGKQWWKGTYNELSYFAKHFFELGLNAQKGE